MEAPEISVMFATVCDLDPLWKRPIVAPPPSSPEMSGASWRDEETTGGDATLHPIWEFATAPNMSLIYLEKR